MKDNLVSVIMSVYNETPLFLKQSIESILNQTYANIEFIIVLDNPDNNEARKLIKDYREKDGRVILIENETNIGLPKSLNKAIIQAQGLYLARMDADDISVNTRLFEESNYLDNHPSCGLVYSYRRDINEDGSFLRTTVLKPFCDYSLKKTLNYGSIITHPTVMVRRDLIVKVSGYQNFKSGQDYDLWLRLKNIGTNFHFINKPLLLYRIRENSISVSKKNMQILNTMYAKLINKKKRAFDEHEYEIFIKNKSIERGFVEYIDILQSHNQFARAIRLFFNVYGRKSICNSLMIRLFAY